MCLWCPFLEPHLTMYKPLKYKCHIKICDCIIGTSTLYSWFYTRRHIINPIEDTASDTCFLAIGCSYPIPTSPCRGLHLALVIKWSYYPFLREKRKKRKISKSCIDEDLRAEDTERALGVEYCFIALEKSGRGRILLRNQESQDRPRLFGSWYRPQG